MSQSNSFEANALCFILGGIICSFTVGYFGNLDAEKDIKHIDSLNKNLSSILNNARTPDEVKARDNLVKDKFVKMNWYVSNMKEVGQSKSQQILSQLNGLPGNEAIKKQKELKAQGVNVDFTCEFVR